MKTCKFSDFKTLAVTVNPNNKLVQQVRGGPVLPGDETPSQVTMCPWFLEWAVGATIPVSLQHTQVPDSPG